MEFKKVSVNNEKRDLCKYFLSFFEDIDDVFPEMCCHPLSSLTEEEYQKSLNFYDENYEDLTFNLFFNDVLKCDIIHSLLKEQNQIKDVEIDIIDIPLFNTILLQTMADVMALEKIHHINPKTLILYGFIYSRIYSQSILENKKAFREHKHKIHKPLEKMFKKEYSLVYQNKMFQAYCDLK